MVRPQLKAKRSQGNRGQGGAGGRAGGGDRNGRDVSKFRGTKRSAGNPNFPQRWSKGQSCESNPQTKKFRSQVGAGQFNLHNAIDNPMLTVTNVEQRAGEEDDMDFDEDVLSEDVQSLTMSDARSIGRLTSASSVKSFATGFSKCTNSAFDRFFSRFKFDSALHKDMLSLLAASTEVINDMGGKHGEIEYFASFISTLNKCEPIHYEPMMGLLCMIIGKVPPHVLAIKFNDIHPKIAQILTESIQSYNSNLTRLCCESLMKILGALDPRRFDSEEDVQKLLNLILKCALSENPKVRRKARKAISFLMSRHNEKNSNILNKFLLGWVLDHLLSFPACGIKTITDALGLLHFSWHYVQSLPYSGAKKLFEAILRVMSSGDAAILKISFTVFSSVFQTGINTPPPISETESTHESFIPKLISALWDFRPDYRSIEAFEGWLQCILEGVHRLRQEDTLLGLNYLPLIIEAISPTWGSTFGQITCVLFAKYVFHIIDTPDPSPTVPIVDSCFKILSKHLISIPPNPHCVITLNAFLDSLSPPHFCPSAKQVFLQIAPLKSKSSTLDKTLGIFVKAFGVENLWGAVNAEIRLSVLLPLLRDNLKDGSIAFWRKMILPLSTNPALQPIVWDSFVGFCRNPTDPSELPAEILGKTIWENPGVRLSALAGLRQFLLWPQCRAIAEKYAKNYLPILFNTFVKEKDLGKKEGHPGHSDSLGKTIEDYLGFVDDEFHGALLEKAIGKYESNSSGVLDLMALLVSRREIDSDICGRVVGIAKGLLGDPNAMKKAYRVLGALVRNDGVPEEIKEGIVKLLRENKGKAKSNAEALRLDLLNVLATKDEGLLKEFLPEAILNLLSVNAKARKVALAFVHVVSSKIKGEEGSKGKELDSVMDIIELGLKSDSNFVIASTLRFLSLLTKDISPPQPNGTLVFNAVGLIHKQMGLEEKDETIIREAMAYLSLNLSLYKGGMGPHAKELGQLLALNGLPRKDVNKMLAQLMRIFGLAGLKSVLVNAEEPKMKTRLRNLQRKLKKMAEGRKGGKKVGDEDMGSEEEEEDDLKGLMEVGTLDAGNKDLVIKEGLVDFLDPKGVTGALVNNRKAEESSLDFSKMVDEEEEGGSARKRFKKGGKPSKPSFKTGKKGKRRR